MDYGTIDRINEDGIIFSVAYKENEKDVAFKRLTTTHGGNITFVSTTQDNEVVEDGSEIVLTSKNAFDEGVLADNKRMDQDVNAGGFMSNTYAWPDNRKRMVDGVERLLWQHSDFKNLAYFFVYQIFNEIANEQ